MTKSTLHWDCKAVQVKNGAPICEGRAIRIHAQIQDDGNIESRPIPDDIRKALSEPGSLVNLEPPEQ